MKKLRESLKTVLIVVLSALTVYLVMLTWVSSTSGLNTENSVLGRLFSLGMSAAPLPPDRSGGAGSEIYELPFLASVALENGRYGLAYDREGMIRLFNAVRPVLSEAYASADLSWADSGGAGWQEVIDAGTVFDFGSDLPVWLIARDIGEASPGLEGIYARYIALVPMGDRLSLFCREESGRVTMFSTEVRTIPYSDAIRQFSPNSALFAFEAGDEYKNIAFDQLVGIPLPEITACRVENILRKDDGTAASRLLEAFLFNPASVHKYTSGRGEDVYVSDSGLLTVRSYSRVIYEASEGGVAVPELAPDLPDGDYRLLAAARNLVHSAVPGGMARYYLRQVTFEGDLATVVFGVEAGGVRLMDDGRFNFAVVTLKEGNVISAEIMFMSLAADESERYVLPERQAIGLAEKPGARMEFAYNGKDSFYRLSRLFRYVEERDGTF